MALKEIDKQIYKSNSVPVNYVQKYQKRWVIQIVENLQFTF